MTNITMSFFIKWESCHATCTTMYNTSLSDGEKLIEWGVIHKITVSDSHMKHSKC